MKENNGPAIRKDRKCVHQQLYMVDVVLEEDQTKESEPYETEVARKSEIVQGEGVEVMLKRRRPLHFDKRHQLDLILEAQELAEFGNQELSPTESDEEEDQELDAKCIDI